MIKPIESCGVMTVNKAAAVWMLIGALVALPAGAAEEPANLITVQAGGAGAGYALDAATEAVRQATLSTQVPGAIVALRVKAGDRVRAGQELVRIDARAAELQVTSSGAQLEAAQAQLRVAARELDRQKQLYERKFVSQGALDRAQGEWEAAQANVAALQAQTRATRVQTNFFEISAPFDGVVSEVPVVLGDMALPGRPLVVMHDPATLRLVAAVPQSLLGRAAKAATTLKYEIPGVVDAPAGAAPAQLLPALDPVTHTGQLRIALPAGLAGAAPGLYARVWLPAEAGGAAAAGAANRILVPQAAIVRRAELTGVLVVDAAGTRRLRQVRLGATQGDRVEVLSGLRPGERIVATPLPAGSVPATPAATPAASGAPAKDRP